MPEAKLLYLSFQHFVDLDKRDQFDIFTLQDTFSLSRFNVTYKVLGRYPDTAEVALIKSQFEYVQTCKQSNWDKFLYQKT